MKQPRAWQRMLSGRRLDLLDPTPMDIEIEDIAHGLAFVARWNGQTLGDYAYSVAEHSLLVEELFARANPGIDLRWRLAALLHDAPEYVIGDMISPFKAVIGGAYKVIETRLQAAVHLRFGLPVQLAERLVTDIKRADQIAAYFEATELAGFATAEAAKFFGRPRGFSADALDLAVVRHERLGLVLAQPLAVLADGPPKAVGAQRRVAMLLRLAPLEEARGCLETLHGEHDQKAHGCHRHRSASEMGLCSEVQLAAWARGAGWRSRKS